MTRIRHGRWLALLGSLLASAAGLACARAKGPDVPRPAEAEPRYLDLAIDVLTSGTGSPSLEDVPTADLLGIREAVARTLQAYMTGSFDAFLQAHRTDVRWAARARASDLPSLQAILIHELGVPPREVPEEWTAALRVFWDVYYGSRPVIRSLDPPASHYEIRVHEAASGESALADFLQSFEEIRERHAVRANARVALPHRRSLERISEDEGELVSFDLRLAVELGRAEVTLPSTLWVRYAWDESTKEWFLCRGLTVYEDAAVVETHPVFVLF